MKCREKKRTGELAQLPKQINERNRDTNKTRDYMIYFRQFLKTYLKVLLYQILTAEFYKSINKEIFDCMGRGERWCREIQQKRKNGSIYLAELEIFPISTNGILIARVSIQRDITKRILLQEALLESRKSYEALLRALPVGAILTSADGKCFYTNEQTSKTLGLPAGEMTGLKWAKALHPEDKESVLTEWKRCIKNHEPKNYWIV